MFFCLGHQSVCHKFLLIAYFTRLARKRALVVNYLLA